MGEFRIGATIKTARERRGWSRELLAVQSGLSWSAISQIESGRRTNLRPSSLSALARALDVSVDYLLGTAHLPSGGLLTHRALAYDTDAALVEGLAPFLAAGVARNEPALVVTNGHNRSLLAEALGEGAQQVEFVDSETWYLRPAATLRAYAAFVASKLDAGAAWIRIVGEPIWSRRTPEQVSAWARYESLINLALSAAPAEIICPYDARAVSPEILTRAMRTHPHPPGASPDSAYLDPADFILASP